MRDKFRGRDFLTSMDFPREEINDIFNVICSAQTGLTHPSCENYITRSQGGHLYG